MNRLTAVCDKEGRESELWLKREEVGWKDGLRVLMVSCECTRKRRVSNGRERVVLLGTGKVEGKEERQRETEPKTKKKRGRGNHEILHGSNETDTNIDRK